MMGYNFEVFKVKQYNSTYKFIVVKNRIPLFCTKSEKRAYEYVAIMQGYGSVENVKDGAIKRIIEREIVQ